MGCGTTNGTITLYGGPFQVTSAPPPVKHCLSRLQFAVQSTKITILGFGFEKMDAINPTFELIDLKY